MAMTVTKKELALQVAVRAGIRKQEAYRAVESIFGAMRESLIEGNRIEIRGFGVLGVKHTKAKPSARNPRTGEVVRVPARRKSYFKAGLLIKEALHAPRVQLDRFRATGSPGNPIDPDGTAIGIRI
jgi:nucleoid DNA-binding protein